MIPVRADRYDMEEGPSSDDENEDDEDNHDDDNDCNNDGEGGKDSKSTDIIKKVGDKA